MKRFTLIAIFLVATMFAAGGSAFALEPWHPDKAKPDKVFTIVKPEVLVHNETTMAEMFACSQVFINSPSDEGKSMIPIDGYYSTPYFYGIVSNTAKAKHEQVITGRCTFY